MDRGEYTRNKIVEAIKEYSEKNGFPPSIREIKEATGLKSTSSVHEQLKKLQNQGVLEKSEGKGRSRTSRIAEKSDAERIQRVFERIKTKTEMLKRWMEIIQEQIAAYNDELMDAKIICKQKKDRKANEMIKELEKTMRMESDITYHINVLEQRVEMISHKIADCAGATEKEKK